MSTDKVKVVVYVEKEMYDTLHRLAWLAQFSVSGLGRQLFKEFLDKYSEKELSDE